MVLVWGIKPQFGGVLLGVQELDPQLAPFSDVCVSVSQSQAVTCHAKRDHVSKSACVGLVWVEHVSWTISKTDLRLSVSPRLFQRRWYCK